VPGDLYSCWLYILCEREKKKEEYKATIIMEVVM
jgi:hypothetical protein